MIPTRLTTYPGLVRAQESVFMRTAFSSAVVVSVVCATAVAGASFAISSFAMPAVYDLPDDEAVRTMQYISLYVVPPSFSLALIGSGAYGLGLVALDLLTRGRRASVSLAIGAACYILGVVGVTLFGSMPVEEGLIALDSASLPVDAWVSYATAWVGFNNLRTLAASVSALCFLVAMGRRLSGRPSA